MKRALQYLTSLILLLVLLNSGAQMSFAKTTTHDDVVSLPSGQTVDNFFTFGQNASINGTVRNLVLVVGGNLHIHSKAKIKELIIVIDGTVSQDQGTHVTENIFSFDWNRSVRDSILFGGIILLSSWVAKLIFAIIMMGISTLMGLFIPKLMKNQGLLGNGKLWLTGFIASLWVVILVIVLVVTIVGIPLALILLLVPLIAFFFAAGAFSREIGLRLLPERQGGWLSTVLGAFILTALFGFPIIGMLIYIGLTILSLGHLIRWIVDAWKGRKRA
ncbi:MAG TPA: hypothetical protein VLK78_01525 [Candidatus Angelobacter sp.]|nr:hypothetical protein [Candidatus Angelobacter sp.]